MEADLKMVKINLPSSTAITRVDAPKVTFPTEKKHGIPNEIEMVEAFRFKTPSSILIVGPSGCGKTCFTESLLLGHMEELFVNPPHKIHYCYWRGKMDSETWKTVPTTFHLRKWFPKGGLLVLDDLISLCCTCARTCFHQGNTQRVFPGMPTMSVIAFKNPRDQLGMKNLLLQAFPTCWQDMMDVYQKVTERPFGYTVLDLHPASDDRKRVFSHLLMHEGYPRWHRRIKKKDL